MRMHKNVAMFAAGLMLMAAVGLRASEQAEGDILSVLKANGHFRVLLTALKDTKLDALLHERGPFTLLAPTDAAFASVPQLADLLENVPWLTAVLQNHIISGRRLSAAEIDNMRRLTMLSGKTVSVSSDGKLDDASIVYPNLAASNGVVQGIDLVLMQNNARTTAESAGDEIDSGFDTMYKGLKHGTHQIKCAFGACDDDNGSSEQERAK